MYYYYCANDCVRSGCRFEIAFVDRARRNPGRAMRGTLCCRRLIARYRRVAPIGTDACAWSGSSVSPPPQNTVFKSSEPNFTVDGLTSFYPSEIVFRVMSRRRQNGSSFLVTAPPLVLVRSRKPPSTPTRTANGFVQNRVI